MRAAGSEITSPSLWLELTGDCNLSCAFCYNPWRPAPKGETPSTLTGAEMIAAITRLSRWTDFEYVALSGGEPLMYRDLDDVLDWLVQQDFHTVLTTNGTLLSTRRLAELRATGLSAVQISLTSIREETHNRLTRSRSWATTIGSIARAAASGIPTTVVVTATQQNVRDLPRTAEFLSQIGVSRITISRLQPAGSAAENLAYLEIDDAQLIETIAQVERLLAPNGTVHSISPPFGQSKHAGWHRWTISPDGKLKICNTAHSDLGSISEIAEPYLERIAADWGAGNLLPYRSFADSCGCFARRVVTGGW